MNVINKVLIFGLSIFAMSACTDAKSDGSNSMETEIAYSFESYRKIDLDNGKIDCQRLVDLEDNEDDYEKIYEYESSNRYKFSQCRAEIEFKRVLFCKNEIQKRFFYWGVSDSVKDIIPFCADSLAYVIDKSSVDNTPDNVFNGGKLVKLHGYTAYFNADLIEYVHFPVNFDLDLKDDEGNALGNDNFYLIKLEFYEIGDKYAYFKTKEQANEFIELLSRVMN